MSSCSACFLFPSKYRALMIISLLLWNSQIRNFYGMLMCCEKFPIRRARKFPGIHRFLSLTVRACLHGGGGPQVGEVTRLGGVRKEPSSTCNLTTRLTREQEKCWQTTCFGFSTLTCCSCCNLQSCCFLLLIKLKWEIIWTGGRLPHLPGVPHLHEKGPKSSNLKFWKLPFMITTV